MPERPADTSRFRPCWTEVSLRYQEGQLLQSMDTIAWHQTGIHRFWQLTNAKACQSLDAAGAQAITRQLDKTFFAELSDTDCKLSRTTCYPPRLS